MPTDMSLSEQVLVAMRRVMRAIDIHSSKLLQTHGLTGPQAIVLKQIEKQGALPVSDLAKQATLSQATVTEMINRLEKRGIVIKQRSDTDKRKVLVSLSEAGQQLMQTSPPLLQEHFIQRFQQLQGWEQMQLLASLQRIAALMDAEDIDAAPVLSSGVVHAAAEDIASAVGLPEEKMKGN